MDKMSRDRNNVINSHQRIFRTDRMQNVQKENERDNHQHPKEEIKKRPGSEKNMIYNRRTRDYFETMTAIATDKGFDGVYDWESKAAENGEIVVKSWQRSAPIEPSCYVATNALDQDEEIKKRPGSDLEIVRTPRTKDYFDNLTAISTDKGFDGVNLWESKTAGNGETVVFSYQRNNPAIYVYYGFEAVKSKELAEETNTEIANNDKTETFKKGGDKLPTEENEKLHPDKFYGVEIVRNATINTSGVFGAVLSTGSGTPDAGMIKDPLGDIKKLIRSVKKAGNIKEMEITIVGWVGADWTYDMKEHYEYDLAAAKTNLQKKFEEEAKGKIKIKMNSYKIEHADKLSTRTIIQLR